MRTIITIALLLQAAVALGQDSWSCTTNGNVTTCQGMRDGRWVICQTTRTGNQSFTQCF